MTETEQPPSGPSKRKAPQYGVRNWNTVIDGALAEARGCAHIVVVPNDGKGTAQAASGGTAQAASGGTAQAASGGTAHAECHIHNGRLIGNFVKRHMAKEGTIACSNYRILKKDLHNHARSFRVRMDDSDYHGGEDSARDIRDRLSQLQNCRLLILFDQHDTAHFRDIECNEAASILDSWLYFFGGGSINVLIFCRQLMPVAAMPTRQWYFKMGEVDNITPMPQDFQFDTHTVQQDMGCGLCQGDSTCNEHARPPWQRVIENLLYEEIVENIGPRAIMVRGIRRGFNIKAWSDGLLRNNPRDVVLYTDGHTAKEDVFKRAGLLASVKLFVLMLPLSRNSRVAADLMRQNSFLLKQLSMTMNPAAKFLVFSRGQVDIPANMSTVTFNFERRTQGMAPGKFINFLQIDARRAAGFQPTNYAPLTADYDDLAPLTLHKVVQQKLVGNHYEYVDESGPNLVTESDSGDAEAGMDEEDVASDASSNVAVGQNLDGPDFLY
jgi:hypothetical protein